MKKKDKDKFEDRTFEDLVNDATAYIHGALLEEGGKGFKRAIHLWMHQAIMWDKYGKYSYEKT